MFAIKTNTRQTRQISIVEALENSISTSLDQEAEIRRKMYERIAQGNALAEIEENASSRWGRR